MVLRELLIKLGLSGGDSTGQALDKVDGKVKGLTHSFQSLGGVITGVFAGLSIKSIIDTADHMQSLEFRLGQMQTSVNGGAAAFDDLAKHAQDSRVSIESYAESYTGIGAATHELIKTQEDLANVTDSVAMGLQLAGANTQQTTSVMQQLTQAIAVGKLQWADMRIIMQNSDAFAGRLAKSLGMSLNEMVKATQGQGGGIGADKIVNALRGMTGQVRKEFASMPMTVGQALAVVGARWDSFVARLNRGSKAISSVAGWVLKLADVVEHAMNEAVKAVGGAENAVKLLASALAGLGIVASIYAIRAAVAALASPISLVALAAASLYLAFDDFRVWQQGGDSILKDLFGDYSQYAPTIEAMLKGIKTIKDGVGGWKTVLEVFLVYLSGSWLSKVLKVFGRVSGLAMPKWLWLWGLYAGYLADDHENIKDSAKSSVDYTKQNIGDAIRWFGISTNYGKNPDTVRGTPQAALDIPGNDIQSIINSGLYTRTIASENRARQSQVNYNPVINLTVNSATGSPDDLQKAVENAMSGHVEKVRDAFSSDMLFNSGVNR